MCWPQRYQHNLMLGILYLGMDKLLTVTQQPNSQKLGGKLEAMSTVHMQLSNLSNFQKKKFTIGKAKFFRRYRAKIKKNAGKI